MNVTKTVKLKITSHSNIFNQTLEIYNDALLFLIDIVSKEWKNLENLSSKERVNFVEKISHETKKNPSPKYNFDEHFYKYPSYLRRATISDAIGIIASHFSRYANWEEKRDKKLAKGKNSMKNLQKFRKKQTHFLFSIKRRCFKKYQMEKLKSRFSILMIGDGLR